MKYVKDISVFINEALIKTDADRTWRDKVTKEYKTEKVKVRDNTKTLALLKYIMDADDQGGRRYTDIVKFLLNYDSGREEKDWEYKRKNRGYWATRLYGGGGFSKNPQGILDQFCSKSKEGKWILTDEKIRKYLLSKEMHDAFKKSGYEDITF